MQYYIPLILSYLIGSITFSFVVGKLFMGIDVREHGSGNAGATNTLRTLGKVPGIAVLVLDLLKGVAAIGIAKWIAPDELWVAAASGVLVVIGHNWPIYFGFKGGKGVATTLGVAATLCFLPTLIATIIIVVIIALTRYVSLGSLVFATVLPLFIWLLYDPVPLEILFVSFIFTIFTYVRHRKNIANLLQGKENKLGQKAR